MTIKFLINHVLDGGGVYNEENVRFSLNLAIYESQAYDYLSKMAKISQYFTVWMGDDIRSRNIDELGKVNNIRSFRRWAKVWKTCKKNSFSHNTC